MRKQKLLFVLLLMTIFLKSFAQDKILLEIDTCSFQSLTGNSIAIKAKITNKTMNTITVFSPTGSRVGAGDQYIWDVSFMRDTVRYTFENDERFDCFGYNHLQDVTIEPNSDFVFKLFIDPNRLKPESVSQNYKVQVRVKVDQSDITAQATAPTKKKKKQSVNLYNLYYNHTPRIIIQSNTIWINYKKKE